MSKARTTFLERLSAYGDAIKVEVLISHEPSESAYNHRARLMRNGLSVVGFAILEDFIKSRTAEVLQRLGSSTVAFEQLPERLRMAGIIGVVNALAFQTRSKFGDLDMSDVVALIQEHARALASTSSGAYQFSSLSLGWEKSNLNAEDVKNMLGAFLVKDAWGNIDLVAQRVGLSALSHKSAFTLAAQRRHQAAHNANADTEFTDLEYFYNQALGIAIGYDVLISKCLRRIMDADTSYLQSDQAFITSDEVSFRFLDTDGSKWREKLENASRAYRISPAFEQIKQDCLSRSIQRRETVIVRDIRSIPTYWYIQDVA